MTFDPNQQPASRPPEDGGGPARRPMVPSFIPPSVVAAVATPKPKSRVPAGTVAFVAALLVASAGLGFAGGRVTAPTAAARTFGNGNGFPTASGGAGGVGRNGGLGGFATGATSVTGQVTAIANGSITIQTSAGQSVTVEVPSTVTYHAQAAATSTDVGVGAQVQLTVNRPTGFRGPDASGAPAASTPTGNGGFNLTATDILVLGK